MTPKRGRFEGGKREVFPHKEGGPGFVVCRGKGGRRGAGPSRGWKGEKKEGSLMSLQGENRLGDLVQTKKKRGVARGTTSGRGKKKLAAAAGERGKEEVLAI